MTPYIQVFERRELKYFLTPSQRAVLLQRLRPFIRPDAYGAYAIGSLYLDTPDYRLIRASLEKPVYKEKLRLRCYGVPRPEDGVYLELKKKFKGVVYKRRLALPLAAAMAYLTEGRPPAEDCRPTNMDGQIFQEIDWCVRRLRPQPRAYIGYDRAAYTGREDERLRITFDTALRWREAPLDLAAGDGGAPLLPADKVLMEVKLPGAMPLWLCRALSDMALYPASFSKYGACYTQYLRVGAHAARPSGGIRYA